MTPEKAVFAAILVCMGGAVMSLGAARRRILAGWLAFTAASVSAVLVGWAACQVLVVGPSADRWAMRMMPKLGITLGLHVDGLTAVFLALASILAMPTALYSIAYMPRHREYGVARYYPSFLLLLAATYGLVSATDMMWILCVLWQLMTLGGYLLIGFENRNAQSVRAANRYLLLSELACVATMGGAALLATGGGASKHEFDTISANLPALLTDSPVMAAAALALLCLGFGIKMGVWPFGQWWIPDAYVALPSPAAALAAAVTCKTGVYGVMRSLLWLVPPEGWPHYPVGRWGMVVATLGTITLFTGTMQALKQEQSKRLLAFHSIGQIGYMLLGIGACMAVLATPGPEAQALAAAAFVGALLHAVNHGLFKGLLFLNAGSMLYATDTQDLNKLGGLMRLMPLTGLTAIIASFSISGVPLFNGFVSKWAIYTGAVQAGGSVHYLPVCAVIAILTSALTLASFIKFFGTSFLSRSSDWVSGRAAGRGGLEVGPLMQIPQVFLAGMCLFVGLTPATTLGVLQTALRASDQGYGRLLAAAAPTAGGPLSGAGTPGISVYMPLAVAVVLGVMFIVGRRLSRLGAAPRRSAEPWLCGYVREAECHRYTAHNFYGEIKRYFRWLGGVPRRSSRGPAD
ncbi:MAG: hypothetical protein IT441_01270 [Phycisphaeraceae bacterium]|nr:hypothetical protein [Phycisphaeraceae bacterium]